MNLVEKLGFGMFFVFVIAVIAGIIGWVMNIIAIAQSSFDVITGMLIARVIGVFIPIIGAVLGYF